MTPCICSSRRTGLFFLLAMIAYGESFIAAEQAARSLAAAGYAQESTISVNALDDDTNSENECGSAADDAKPALPPGDPTDTSVPVLQMGESMRFEEMGPVIINVDGSIRRIDNWDEMTAEEQKVTWRRISKRNAERRAALEAKAKEAAYEEMQDDSRQ